MAKYQPTKKNYLVANGSRVVLTVRQTFGEASKSAALISGGHVIEVTAKTVLTALRTASSQHGYRPDPFLVAELGIRWDFD